MSPVASSEILSRFIFQKNHYRASNNTVKYAAFLPNRNNETSVFRISGISDEQVWAIADIEVASSRGPVKVRADIGALGITSRELSIIPSEPPERHANITDWPDEKPKQIQIALELAAEAQLHIR